MTIKKIFGIEPKLINSNLYSPSWLSLKLATSETTDYFPINFNKPNKNKNLKILVLCTEESELEMANGKNFFTGNHPVEMLVPMLHLKNAGFDFDIFTPTGKSVKIEMWAMPKKDKNVLSIYEEYKIQFDNPKSLAELLDRNFSSNQDYIAVYIPGGHGALIGLPFNKNVGKLIKWAFEKRLFILAICHGPAVFLSAKPEDESTPFIFDGYKIAAFPDAVDRRTPFIGYMPGQLNWFFGDELEKLGITIVNSRADKTCFADRMLITGASPKAANDFGELSATKILEYINLNNANKI